MRKEWSKVRDLTSAQVVSSSAGTWSQGPGLWYFVHHKERQPPPLSKKCKLPWVAFLMITCFHLFHIRSNLKHHPTPQSSLVSVYHPARVTNPCWSQFYPQTLFRETLGPRDEGDTVLPLQDSSVMRACKRLSRVPRELRRRCAVPGRRLVWGLHQGGDVWAGFWRMTCSYLAQRREREF